jgi:MFS family permease
VTNARAARLAVLVAALGYFVDIYDLILFGVVRGPSLKSIGITSPEAVLSTGVDLVNWQMGGMLVGGLVWGVLGDRHGRLSVLFGSIILYSLANLANGMVDTVGQYAACRFIAGIGLAGELGAGITLVSELLDKRQRGWGTTIVASVGISGGVAAGIVGGAIPAIYEGMYWRHAYYVGGGLGLALLVLRIGVVESGMYKDLVARGAGVARGNFFALFTRGERALRYVAVIAVGVPIWYAVGILIFFSPELGTALGVTPVPRPATALMVCYAGLAVGDLASGALSQILGSRRRALAIFLALTAAGVALYFTAGATSITWFYAACGFLGIATGYWAVFVTSASEQFGTNLRATATTTIPNFVRGSVVLITMSFEALRGPLGSVGSAIAVGAGCLALAVAALLVLDETYGKDLDFVED